MHTSCRRPLALLSALAAAALLAACGSTTKLDQPAPVAATARAKAPAVAPAAPTGSATTTPTPQSRVATVDLASRAAPGATFGATPGAAPTAPADAMVMAPSQRVVFFDFDSFAIRSDFSGMIDGHAKFLGLNRDKRMTIEGHADERGSREYNLALGQKRAESVLRSLVLLGVRESQLEAVSFGEERPAAEGSNETAWAQNRRAELKDR